MPAMSSTFEAHQPVHSEERAISLSLKVLPYQPRPARNRFKSGNSVRPIHLFGHNFDHDYYFELPANGSGTPIRYDGDLLHTMGISGLSRVRTELCKLLVAPSLAPHPVQTNG